MIDPKELEILEYFSSFGNKTTNDAKRKREIKSWTAMENAAIQQEQNCFYQQTGLKFKEETHRVLLLEHSFVSCCNLGTSESRSQNTWIILDVALKKDGGYQLNRSCEK